MITAKSGDQYPVTFTANMDLTGAIVVLYARNGALTQTLTSTVTDAANGVVTHDLDGTLDLGSWMVELHVTVNGEVITFPTNGFETLQIVPRLG